MADSLSELSMQPPIDAEAQAAVNDFLDYTEFFPSDLFRSLSLIGKLDGIYKDDTANVHALAKLYSTSPSTAQPDRPSPQSLRNGISASLDHALRCREATYAEANRLCTVADNLYNRLVSIRAKLIAMPTPPSREATPPPQKPVSPQTSRSRRNDGSERAPRLKLFVDTDKANTTVRSQAVQRQKNRVRRIVVPGEIMPPFDPNSPGADLSSESESESLESPVKRPNTARSESTTAEKVVVPKIPKLKLTPKLPKTPRTRAPGVMGTNVHSQVAGISVSNAMASLTPPPETPQAGSEWAPWLDLTDWELHKIRKKMKKNANWQPSDIMKRRELESRGRGPKAMREAREKADTEGASFLHEEPHRPTGLAKQIIAEALASGQRPKLPGFEQLLKGEASPSSPAMPSDELDDEDLDENERRLRQERQEMEKMSNLINQYSATVERMLGQPLMKSPAVNGSDSVVSPSNSATRKASRKRKRESAPETSYILEGDAEPFTQDELDADEAGELLVPTATAEDFDDVIDPALMEGDEEMYDAPEQQDEAVAEASESVIDPALMMEGTVPADPVEDVAEDTDLQAGTTEETPLKKLKLVAPAASTAKKGKKGSMTKVPLAPPGPSGRGANGLSHQDAVEETTAASDRPRRGAPAAAASTATPKAGSISIRLPTPTASRSVDKAKETKSDLDASSTGRRAGTRKSGAAATAADEFATPAPAPSHQKSKSNESTKATASASERPPSRRSARRASIDAAATASSTASASPAVQSPSETPPAKKGGKPGRKPTPKPTPAPGPGRPPAADDEERFCICGEVSYGEMVACENGACPIEWFHLGCVGLEKRPSVRETWFCPRCQDVMGIDVRGNARPEGPTPEKWEGGDAKATGRNKGKGRK